MNDEQKLHLAKVLDEGRAEIERLRAEKAEAVKKIEAEVLEAEVLTFAANTESGIKKWDDYRAGLLFALKALKGTDE